MFSNTSIISTAYLGSVDYYRRLLQNGAAFIIDTSVPFSRQTWMNRCRIDSPNGPLTLTVPVVNPHGRTSVGEVRISEHGNWRHQHWNALVSSYRQTPYFNYYEEDFLPFYEERRWEFLADFNRDLHNTVLRLLGADTAESLELLSQHRHATRESYYQVFAHRHGFTPDLSIIDLLFNMGPEGLLWL